MKNLLKTLVFIALCGLAPFFAGCASAPVEETPVEEAPQSRSEQPEAQPAPAPAGDDMERLD